MKWEWANYAVHASCGNLSRKHAYVQLIREHSVTVISACRATVDWSWPKKKNWCAWGNLHIQKKKKKHRKGMNPTPTPHPPKKRPKGLNRQNLPPKSSQVKKKPKHAGDLCLWKIPLYQRWTASSKLFGNPTSIRNLLLSWMLHICWSWLSLRKSCLNFSWQRCPVGQWNCEEWKMKPKHGAGVGVSSGVWGIEVNKAKQWGDELKKKERDIEMHKGKLQGC